MLIYIPQKLSILVALSIITLLSAIAIPTLLIYPSIYLFGNCVRYSDTGTMRMSCNGCRVLRKGCSEDCVIRPCLQWIRTPEAQANATLFLAKFYGRAGLMNLLSAGSDNLRPAIFRSLLYEACGRILNPVYGSVGLLWSGSWQRCQAAVEAVLKGEPITQLSDAAVAAGVPALKTCDIRHVGKINPHIGVAIKSQPRFKRAGVVHGELAGLVTVVEDDGEESELSVETVEDSHVSQAEPGDEHVGLGLGLDLSLGLN